MSLETMPDSKPIRYDFGKYPGDADSYRGYYEQLALDVLTPGDTVGSKPPPTVGQVLRDLSGAIRMPYTGYKGGEYTMNRATQLWASEWGEASGLGIVGIREHDTHVELVTAQLHRDYSNPRRAAGGTA